MDTSSTTPGQPVVQQIRVKEKPDVVLQRVQAAGMGAPGIDVTSGAPGTYARSTTSSGSSRALPPPPGRSATASSDF